MSIIHDALKKVQNGLQDKTSPLPPAVPLKNSGTKGGWKIIVLILLAVAVLTAGYVYRQNASSPAPHPSAPEIEPPPPVQINAAPVLQPEPRNGGAEAGPKAEPRPEYAAGTLNIHGIMSDPNGNVVLIDNGIYAEGDEVQGVKIIKISLDGIVILKDGKEETVRVGRH